MSEASPSQASQPRAMFVSSAYGTPIHHIRDDSDETDPLQQSKLAHAKTVATYEEASDLSTRSYYNDDINIPPDGVLAKTDKDVSYYVANQLDFFFLEHRVLEFILLLRDFLHLRTLRAWLVVKVQNAHRYFTLNAEDMTYFAKMLGQRRDTADYKEATKHVTENWIVLDSRPRRAMYVYAGTAADVTKSYLSKMALTAIPYVAHYALTANDEFVKQMLNTFKCLGFYAPETNDHAAMLVIKSIEGLLKGPMHTIDNMPCDNLKVVVALVAIAVFDGKCADERGIPSHIKLLQFVTPAPSHTVIVGTQQLYWICNELAGVIQEGFSKNLFIKICQDIALMIKSSSAVSTLPPNNNTYAFQASYPTSHPVSPALMPSYSSSSTPPAVYIQSDSQTTVSDSKLPLSDRVVDMRRSLFKPPYSSSLSASSSSSSSSSPPSASMYTQSVSINARHQHKKPTFDDEEQYFNSGDDDASIHHKTRRTRTDPEKSNALASLQIHKPRGHTYNSSSSNSSKKNVLEMLMDHIGTSSSPSLNDVLFASDISAPVCLDDDSDTDPGPIQEAAALAHEVYEGAEHGTEYLRAQPFNLGIMFRLYTMLNDGVINPDKIVKLVRLVFYENIHGRHTSFDSRMFLGPLLQYPVTQRKVSVVANLILMIIKRTTPNAHWSPDETWKNVEPEFDIKKLAIVDKKTLMGRVDLNSIVKVMGRRLENLTSKPIEWYVNAYITLRAFDRAYPAAFERERIAYDAKIKRWAAMITEYRPQKSKDVISSKRMQDRI